MLQGVYGVVKNVTIFLILVNVVMNLFGNKDYQKYVSLFVGMVLILIAVNPILSWFGGEEALSSKIRLSGFVSDNVEWDARLRLADEKGREQIWESYKWQMKQQIEMVLEQKKLFLNDISITVEEDEESGTYGGVRSIELTAGRTDSESRAEGADVLIERIRIDGDGGTKGDSEEDGSEENVSSLMLAQEIQGELAVLYRMEKEDVRVRIQN